MLSKLKDKASATALKTAANRYLRDFGVIETLTIESRNKRIFACVRLHGEDEALNVTITSYRLVCEEGRYRLYIDEMDISKPWMQALAKRFIVSKGFDIPEEAAKIAIKII